MAKFNRQLALLGAIRVKARLNAPDPSGRDFTRGLSKAARNGRECARQSAACAVASHQRYYAGAVQGNGRYSDTPSALF